MGWIKWSFAMALVGVAAHFLYFNRTDPISELDVYGFCKPEYGPLMDTFRKNLKSGWMRGASFSAYVDGELAVNVWGGYTDETHQVRWTKNTITHVASITKMVCALAFSTLIDKGYVNYDDLVSKYWPEFAQNGKEHVTVNMLINHQAGVYVLDKQVSFNDIVNDPDKVEKILAEQKPFWLPGTKIGYHALTIGMYVDFLARKVDPKHRSIYQIYEEDIKIPLDLDFFIGTPYSEHYRIARVHPSEAKDILYSLLTMHPHRRAMFYVLLGDPWLTNIWKGMVMQEVNSLFGDPELRATPIPAAGGIGTAESLARMTGFVAAGKPVNGKPLLSDGVVGKLNTPSLTSQELVTKYNVTTGHGMYIFQNPWGENVFGQPGAGGQMSYVDPTNKVGLAFLTNFFTPFSLNDDARFVALEKAFYDCLRNKRK